MTNELGDRTMRSGFRFFWIALVVIIAIGIVWLVAGAVSHPAHKADSTEVGNSPRTTPAVPTNGGDVASVSTGQATAVSASR